MLVRWALVLLLAACGPTAAGQGGPGAPNSAQTLESELARLGGATDQATSVARSRILRALERQPEALAQLEVAADGARDALDWAGLSALWREVGDVYLELGQPQQALDAFGKRLKTAVSLGAQTERAFALVDTAYAFALMGAMTRADEALGEALLLAGAALRGDPDAMERVALTRERLNDPEGAAELLGAAAAAYQGRGDATGAARAAVLRAQLQARAGHPEALAGLDDAVARSLDPEPRARLARYR